MKNIEESIVSVVIKFSTLIFIIFLFGFQKKVSAQPIAPNNVTVSPSSVTCGVSTSLNATTSGNNVIIRWWDASASGNLLGSSVSGANFIFYPYASMPVYAEAFDTVTGLPSVSRVSTTISVNPLPAPTSVLATPDSISCGGSSNLYANSVTNLIYWWDAATGGNIIGASQNSTFVNVTPNFGSTTFYAEAYSMGSYSKTFTYTTSSIQTWTVPVGTYSITIEARGASGGYSSGGIAGNGAIMHGTFSVTPGSILSILVGQSPGLYSGNFPGGGGGTFVALGSLYSTAIPLIVAGGGGGGAALSSNGVGVNAPVTINGTGSNRVQMVMVHLLQLALEEEEDFIHQGQMIHSGFMVEEDFNKEVQEDAQLQHI